MLMKGVTLRGLEVFEALAESGSVAKAAEGTGLSQPAVSQQMRNLEGALGVDLVDHGRRPMRLTRRLEAGTVWVNRYGRSRDHILPTTGWKSSGLGSDLGREAYRANRRTKSVLIDL